MTDKYKRRNGLPRLRHRLTPFQATERRKRIAARAARRRILSGVRRDPLRKWLNR